MSVKLAAQVFSNSVYSALDIAGKTKEIESKSLENTAHFVQLIDKLWDALNSRSEKENNPYNCAISESNSKVKEILLEGRDYFRKLQKEHAVTKSTKVIPCFNGMQQTIAGILILYEDLTQNYEGISYLPTRPLQQDLLENWFAAVRQKGGNNKNPSARSFRYIFRSKATAFLRKSDSSNTTDDDAKFLNVEGGDGQEAVANKTATTSESYFPIDEPENEVLPVNIINNEDPDEDSLNFEDYEAPNAYSLEKSAVEYFAGYMLGILYRRRFCENKCLPLIQMSPDSFSESTNQLIQKKSYEGLPKDKGFKYPSESFVKLVDLALDIFENQCMPYFYGQNFLELSYRRIERATTKKFGSVSKFMC